MPREIYVEFVILGNSVKATAIDPETGLEASVVGPANAPQSTMAQAARRKLEFLAARKKD
ncbi:MAG: serine hydroxymethyltransferase [Alphaproteobacteria bacterium]